MFLMFERELVVVNLVIKQYSVMTESLGAVMTVAKKY